MRAGYSVDADGATALDDVAEDGDVHDPAQMSHEPVGQRPSLQRRSALVVLDPEQDRRDGVLVVTAQRLIDAGRYDEARGLLAPLADDPVTSIRAQGALLFAALSSMLGDGAGVLSVLDRIPAHGVVVDRGFLLLLRAQAHRQVRRIPEAIADATAACRHGETPARLLVLADALKAAGDVDGACSALERARALSPAHPAVLGQLAGLHALGQRRAASDEALAALLGLPEDSRDADWHRNRAFAHACRRERQEARHALAHALHAEPSITRAWLHDEEELAPLRDDPLLR